MLYRGPFWFFFVFCLSFVFVPSMIAIGYAKLIIDADLQFDYANSLFEDKAFEESIIEFNRFIYFFPENPKIEKAKFQIGMAHFHATQYSDAASVFSRLTQESSNLAFTADAHFMLSQSHARQGKIEQAMVDLHNLMTISTEPEILDRARYELGWLNIDQGLWDKANESFKYITSNNQELFSLNELMLTLAQADQIPYKSPSVAGVLSLFPGGGQIYCNRYKDALTAFLVNAGLIWAAWEAFDNELYALGGVISFVEFGFYSGNIYGAISSAHKSNREKNTEFKNNLYQRRQFSLSMGPVPNGLALGLRVSF